MRFEIYTEGMLLDKIIGIVAPFECVVCGREGKIVCANCLGTVAIAKASTCFLCNKLTDRWQTCKACRKKTKIKGVIIASHYEGPVKDLVRRLKYQRTISAADVLAKLLAGLIDKDRFDLITWVPASTQRQRQRGYNQAELIAKSLARRLELPYSVSLSRLGHERQVGTTRQIRFRQLQNKMYAVAKYRWQGKRVLVIDDVVTTGASINEAGRALKEAGAKSIWSAAVAKH